MPGTKPSELASDARRRNLELAARLGGALREARRRRRLTQAQLGHRSGLSQSAVSDIERGNGGGYSLESWQNLFLAVDRPLMVEARRDPLDDVRDAGHLAIQELVLRVAAARDSTRRSSSQFALACLATRSTSSCGTTSGGCSWCARRGTRSATLEQALAHSPGSSGRQNSSREHWASTARIACEAAWVVRATTANRNLLRRYPTIFASRFPGSSLAWWRTLIAGDDPPAQPGLVWSDREASKLFPLRHR